MDYFSQVIPILEQLKSASDEQSWEECARLDSTLREKIDTMASALSTEEEKRAFEQTLRRLQKIVGLVQAGVQSHRKEIATELAQISREQKAAQSYLKLSGLS